MDYCLLDIICGIYYYYLTWRNKGLLHRTLYVRQECYFGFTANSKWTNKVNSYYLHNVNASEVQVDRRPWKVDRNRCEIIKYSILNNNFTMAYWLVKSEPSSYSWEQLVKDKITTWDGVRNFAARNHLKSMKKDDQVLFYHSNEGLNIVGIAKVAKESYPDPRDSAWIVVDLKPHKKLKNPVSLAEIKADKRLSDMALVRIGRLSVQPVTDDEWKVIMEYAGQGK
jgi:predicted RNA-binding protein with PUA-like domain